VCQGSHERHAVFQCEKSHGFETIPTITNIKSRYYVVDNTCVDLPAKPPLLNENVISIMMAYCMSSVSNRARHMYSTSYRDGNRTLRWIWV